MREESNRRKTVFLDRDGTINVEVNYLHRPEDLVLLPGVPEAVRLLNEAGFRVAVVTNQAGVARGYYGEEDVMRLHEYLNRLLETQGAHIDDFYYCPHHPEHGIGKYKTDCRCRKPGTGMFEAADRDCPVERARSFMVGDKLIDTLAGHNFGLRSILVGTGYGKEIRKKEEAMGEVLPELKPDPALGPDLSLNKSRGTAADPAAVPGPSELFGKPGNQNGDYDWYAADLREAAELIAALDRKAGEENGPVSGKRELEEGAAARGEEN